MAEFFLALFIFLGVMAVTALIFGGWIIVSVVRGITSLFGVHTPPQPPRKMRSAYHFGPPFIAPNGHVRCNVPGCRHSNPEGARFCRHCGHAFPPPQQTAARRA